jgi:hypothetical protein
LGTGIVVAIRLCLFDLPADPKAADGFYETEVVQAQEAE